MLIGCTLMGLLAIASAAPAQTGEAESRPAPVDAAAGSSAEAGAVTLNSAIDLFVQRQRGRYGGRIDNYLEQLAASATSLQRQQGVDVLMAAYQKELAADAPDQRFLFDLSRLVALVHASGPTPHHDDPAADPQVDSQAVAEWVNRSLSHLPAIELNIRSRWTSQWRLANTLSMQLEHTRGRQFAPQVSQEFERLLPTLSEAIVDHHGELSRGRLEAHRADLARYAASVTEYPALRQLLADYASAYNSRDSAAFWGLFVETAAQGSPPLAECIEQQQWRISELAVHSSSVTAGAARIHATIRYQDRSGVDGRPQRALFRARKDAGRWKLE